MLASLVIAVLFSTIYILFFAVAGMCISIFIKTDIVEFQKPHKTRFLILVPAHNESEYLRPTIRSIFALDYPCMQFDIVVIADNCTDNTAFIAIQEGCEVWERNNLDLRGKGHALEWAFEIARKLFYDAIVVIDADTTASANLLQTFDREIHTGSLVIQSLYQFAFPADTSRWFSLISQASKRSEDCFISRPRSQFGLYQGLQGNGFCLHRSVLENIPWTASSIPACR